MPSRNHTLYSLILINYRYDEMCSLLVKQGTFIPLNAQLKPNCYAARSDPRDVARVESKTFICTEHEEDAGMPPSFFSSDKMFVNIFLLYFVPFFLFWKYILIILGPTNNWMDPTKMRERLNSLFNGCMKGRVMYFLFFHSLPLFD